MATILPVAPTRSQKPPEDIERGLTALALCGSNSERAAQLLAEQGTSITSRSLRYWRHRYADRYAEIREERVQQVERLVTHEARDLALAYAQLEHKAIGKTTEALDAGTLKDPSAAMRNAAVAKAVNIDKLLALEGRPTTVIEHRNSHELLRSLAAKGFVDSTATELPHTPPKNQSVPEGSHPNARKPKQLGPGEPSAST